jgi:alkanesulfonate monooxygenase SsuD/methylene tetrahydromethanopterin reductase-like flavin-dependent oxidoreductase (luciferase family)
LREYVEVVRMVLRREPLAYDGTEFPLPYRGLGSTGQGKPLRSILHPNPDIPIWLATGGPANTALAAEIADGWLPMGFGPDGLDVYGPALDAGFARRDPTHAPLEIRPHFEIRPPFEIFAPCNVEITDDVRAAIDARKPLTAMYVGGMGSATHNFHREAMARRGFPDEAARIHELWLGGRRDEAVAAVPDAYIEQSLLAGSADRIRARWDDDAWETRGLTGLIVRAETDDELELVADLAGTSDEVT